MTTEFWMIARSYLDSVGVWIALYAIGLSIFQVIQATRKLPHYYLTRHLQRVWGIKNGDQVIVVCSELDEPEQRQRVESREFIYSYKYGDLDAYVEVLVTLLRLYPAIKMRVMSAGEVEQTPLDLARHLVVIGGPDYNPLAERILDGSKTQYDYKSPYVTERSKLYPEEIVLYDKRGKQEYCHNTEDKDFGYFERIINPHNPKSRIILIGGCHTIGVAGAVKAFSMGASDDGEIRSAVLANAKLVSKKIKKSDTFSVLVEVEKIGQTISVPVVEDQKVTASAPNM